MIPRYQDEEITAIFSDEHRFKTWFRVELAYLKARLHFFNQADDKLLARLESWQHSIDWQQFAENVAQHELRVRHDVIAFLCALEDQVGEDARLIHFGLTSSDIVDTALAIQLVEASNVIDRCLSALIDSLSEKAQACKGMMALGRTHGQAAEPITFGLKWLGFVAEFDRAQVRLRQVGADIGVGKFSGAVGTSAFSEPEIEEEALRSLGLQVETVATQVVARDRHAHFFATLAVIAGSMERLAVDIRLLSHDLVGEVSEGFAPGQKGSSAMPHKKNPILAENVSGLSRLLRAYALASFENQALWHERDISHSSVERVIAPDACSVLAFALRRLKHVIDELVINNEHIEQNLARASDVVFSQGVMLALIEKGLSRQRAYELVQKAAHGNVSFKKKLVSLGVENYLTRAELDALFDVGLMLRHEEKFFKRVAAARQKEI